MSSSEAINLAHCAAAGGSHLPHLLFALFAKLGKNAGQIHSDVVRMRERQGLALLSYNLKLTGE